MSSKFMKVKRIVIPMMSLIIMLSQMTGCAVVDSKEMVEMINAGQSIVIEVAMPSYEIDIKGELQESMEWIQLDQLKTFNEGFRQGFDEIFNINIVTENGINGKSGCLFVDSDGDRNGNTTLADALRNKVFVEKYWNEEGVKDKIANLSSDIYTDVGNNSNYKIAGTINAYYNLLSNYENPTSFNPTQSLTREEFYTLLFRSEEGVRGIDVNKNFEGAIGGATKLSKYAQERADYGFLKINNNSLDANSYKGSISRAEVIYMIVNRHFSDKLKDVTGKEKAFNDTKNAGDLALKVGFKYKDKDTKDVVGKDRWQSYILAYTIQNPNKGMQEDLYKAMVVAKDVGLIKGDESRWDEPVSKSEAIQFIVNAHLIKNTLYGYLSEVEYGKMNESKFTITKDDDLVVTEIDEDGLERGNDWVEELPGMMPADPSKMLDSGYTLGEIKKSILNFEASLRKDNKDGELTDRDIDTLQRIANNYGTTLEELSRVYLDNTENKEDNKVVEQKPKVEQEKDTTGKVDNKDNKDNKVETKPVEPAKPTLELKTDKWHTKEQKEAARQHAIEHGDKTWEERARDWEDAPDWIKDSRISPYAVITDGTIYYDSLDEIDPSRRDLYRYKEGKGWYYHGRGLIGL